MNLEETMQKIEAADENDLFILWTNADPVTARLMLFMYAENSLKYEKYHSVTIIIWGATTRLTAENLEIQEKIRQLQSIGIHFTACIACATELGVTDKIESLGIDLIKWLNPLTALIKGKKNLITI